MKKRILTVAVAALALAACSKNETVEVADSNLIGFEGAFVGNPTRATVTQVTGTAFDNFYVYATKDGTQNFFENEKVYASNGVWVYDNLKQWEEAEYAFAAYSNGGSSSSVDGKLESGVTFNGSNLEIADYKVDYDDQRDLITSISTTNLNTTNTPVEFTFDHALAMIKFTLTNGVGKNDIEITNFTIKQVGNTATLTTTSSANTWGPTSTTEDVENSTTITSTQTTAGESDEFVVIPQQGTNLVVSFTATITPDGGSPITKPLTATIASYDWKASCRYNYTATITGTDMDVIEFAAPTVTEWDDYTDVNEDID